MATSFTTGAGAALAPAVPPARLRSALHAARDGAARAGAAHDGAGLGPELLAELRVLARQPGLLVACNYGGTLTAVDGQTTETLPLDAAAVALRALASLPETHAAVVSGRSLRDLAAVSRLPAEVHLVGSHGHEFDLGFA